MNIKTILSQTILSFAVATLIVGCGGGEDGASSNVNSNGTVTATALQATVVYDGAWRYVISGNLNVTLGSNVSQLNITGLKIKIGDQPEFTQPFAYTVMKSSDNITQEEIPLTEISVVANYIPEGQNRNITITPIGNTVGGSTFVGNSAVASIQGFAASELISAKPYTVDILKSTEVINSYGESNVGVYFNLKNELGATDTTTRMRISTPINIPGLTYDSGFTSARQFYINFPANTTQTPINYQFSVELEQLNGATFSKVLTDSIFTFTQESSLNAVPFTIKGNSGVESTEGSLPRIGSNGSMLVDLNFLNTTYNGDRIQFDIFDMTTGSTLPIYRDFIDDITNGTPITILVNKDENTYWPTNSNIVNTLSTERDLLVEIKIMDGNTQKYKYSQIIKQAGFQEVNVDMRTLSKVAINSDLTRYRNTLGKTTGYLSLTGNYPPFLNSSADYKNYNFSAQIIDSADLVDLPQTFIGGSLWNSVIANSSLLNFNNVNLTIPNTNTIKFDVAFRNLTTLATQEKVNVLFFGKDGNFIDYEIPVLPTDAPASNANQYNLTQTTSITDVGPNTPSGTSLFFNLQNTTSAVNTPMLNLKLLNNKDYLNLTGGTITNTTTEKTIVVPATNQSFASVGVELIQENILGSDVEVPYIAYITVDNKIVSNIIEGNSIKVLAETDANTPKFSVNMVSPAGLFSNESGNVVYSFSHDSGTYAEGEVSPYLQVQVLSNGSYVNNLTQTNVHSTNGSFTVSAEENPTANAIPVEFAYFVTLNGEAVSPISRATINILPEMSTTVQTTTTAVGPSSLTNGTSGSIQANAQITSGSSSSTPQIHFSIVQGGHLVSLGGSIINGIGSVSLTANATGAGEVTIAYWTTVDGKVTTDIQTIDFSVEAAN